MAAALESHAMSVLGIRYTRASKRCRSSRVALFQASSMYSNCAHTQTRTHTHTHKHTRTHTHTHTHTHTNTRTQIAACFSWSRNGRKLLSWSLDQTVVLHDVKNLRICFKTTLPCPAKACAIHPRCVPVRVCKCLPVASKSPHLIHNKRVGGRKSGTHTQTHTHTDTQTQTQTDTHTHTHMHRHRHMHAHTTPLSLLSPEMRTFF